MSDLGLAIDYSSILEAKKATTDLEDSYARMVQAILAEERRLKVLEDNADKRAAAEARAMKKIEDEAQRHYDRLVGKKMAFQRAMDAQRNKEETAAYASLRRQADAENRVFDQKAQANQKAIQDYDRLLQRMDPQYRALQNERSAVEALNRARAAGLKMTDQEYAQKLDLIQNTYRSADAFNQFGVKALMSGKNLGYFGQMVQQGGYQLQDFVVQVQGGTSVFTALGQQGSQFAGIFGPGGAVIGVLIALGAVIGGTLSKSFQTFSRDLNQVSKDAKKAFEDLQKSSDLISKAVSASLADAFKVSKNEMQLFIDTWEKLDQKALGNQMKGVRSALKSSISGQEQSIFDPNWNAASVMEGPKELERIFDTLTADTVPELVKQYIAANDQIARSTAGTKDLRDLARQKLMDSAKEIGIYDEIIQKQKDSAKVEKDKQDSGNDYIMSLIDKYAKQDADRRKALSEQYGLLKDSKGITEDIIALNLASAFDLAAGSASKIAVELNKALSPAMIIADLLARANGGTGGLSQYITQGVLNTNSGGRVPLAGGGPVAHWTMPAGSKPPPARPGDANLDGITDTDFNTKDPTKKGGGGNKKSGDDRIAALLREYDQKKRIAGLTGEQLKQEQARQEVIKALGDDVAKYSEDYIKAKTGEILKAQELIAVEEQRKHIYDTIESSMNDMFMSFADGTKNVKEAFSDMARSIIKELYQVLVVKQAVNAIMGFVGITNMPTVSTPTVVNDAVISPNGQIISTSPDDFLIATKNPQALAHNVSGGNTVNNNTGGVTVHQSFNISGSDAATVQRVLAQSMPAITAATKQAVIDSRRRGSSEMRGAFG